MQNVTTSKPVVVHMDGELRGMLVDLARAADRSMSAQLRTLVRDAHAAQLPRVPDLREVAGVGLTDGSRPLVEAQPATPTRPGRRSVSKAEAESWQRKQD